MSHDKAFVWRVTMLVSVFVLGCGASQAIPGGALHPASPEAAVTPVLPPSTTLTAEGPKIERPQPSAHDHGTMHHHGSSHDHGAAHDHGASKTGAEEAPDATKKGVDKAPAHEHHQHKH